MEQNTNKPLRLRRSQNQIEPLLQEFENGNLKVAEFCDLHTIGKATFHKWQSRYRRKKVKDTEPAGFAKLKIATPHLGLDSVLFAEVKGIKLYQPVTASYLKKLL